MMGIYRVTVDGKIYEFHNMITATGKENALNAIAGRRQGWASSIMVGIDSTATTTDDRQLGFAIGGGDINAVIVDSVNEKIFFKASLRSEDEYEIREIGCYSTNLATLQQPGQTGGSVLVTFGTTNDWVSTVGTHTYDSVNARAGRNTIKYSLLANATGTGHMNLANDLSILSSDVILSFAYNCLNIASLSVRFKVDDSNYFEYNTWSVTNGYHISKASKSSFSLVGTPTWESATELEISATATGTAGAVELDAMRYDSPADSNLLSRVVVDPKKDKLAGKSLDIEYVLDLGFV